jgi:hypothetical protein
MIQQVFEVSQRLKQPDGRHAQFAGVAHQRLDLVVCQGIGRDGAAARGPVAEA